MAKGFEESPFRYSPLVIRPSRGVDPAQAPHDAVAAPERRTRR